MGPDEAYKNKIGERLTRRLAQALKQGEVSEEEFSEICSYILDNIDKAKNNVGLVDFLNDISQKWPIFSQILTIEQGETIDKKEEQAIEQVTDLIKENKIDEALKVAENATDKTGGEN